ncbi:Rne/Rng family ribonuclease [Jiella pelagia]|uniref:Ribonuclease E n=1 Tax=Jiella pelagia TaxID=2986949 RepID=A0ABY7BYH4_9HYPH|nr:Rne/Rng family ribonuclease [Jiella pelagia]WAP68793.1 Rne/Rng family ribonuclease [Jiella pelagia]
MANKMLIDASHQEETRVVVVRGSRIEEFDFESEHKKQLKGNIYLAKVTRVEPSLQAAFVEYGGNRHGFLAFSEIHPDYYQIPKADREALIAEELARGSDDDDDAEEVKPKARGRSGGGRSRGKAANREDGDRIAEAVDATSESDEQQNSDHGEVDAVPGTGEQPFEDVAARGVGSEEAGETDETDSSGSEDGEDNGRTDDEESDDEGGRNRRGRRSRRPRGRGRTSDSDNGDEDSDEAEEIDDLGSEDAMEEVPVRQARSRKQYKIQEVIKRRQILLVQVVKEERGNKGAALTTYLSLAGRYSVLMPNTARGGGISRKITNASDRKRLKDVVRDLEVPKGMGIILRTAGANRTKAEVKRDYEYLMRLWETVRTVTLSSIAPALVYEEGSLIKRSIRDLYNKDIDQILVAGEGGYREAKDFMRMLMPSQAKVVQPYRDPTPIFARQGIETQLDKMLQPHVTLKSGGYIIINQTEALVAIDVNSGRSTREHSIEDTAYQTNLEAAEEVARQLRLRDLAGLIVIDFIDMEEKRNNRAVEKKIKDCLKDDRARIQVGKISHFGLLEMSRQRIRASVLESTMQACTVCGGAGHVRSASSLALHVLRCIEEHLQKHATHDLLVKVPTATALYVLNEKRKRIEELEQQYGLRITIEADEAAVHQAVAIEHGAPAAQPIIRQEVVHPESVFADEQIEIADEEESVVEAVEAKAPEEQKDEGDGNGKRRRRRRRRRRGDRPEDRGDQADASSNGASGDDDGQDGDEDDDADGRDDDESGTEAGVEAGTEAGGETDEDERGSRRRRRGRRGGRRHRDGNGEAGDDNGNADDVASASDADADAEGSNGSDSRTVEVVAAAPFEAAPADVTSVSSVAEDGTGGQEGAAASSVTETVVSESESVSRETTIQLTSTTIEPGEPAVLSNSDLESTDIASPEDSNTGGYEPAIQQLDSGDASQGPDDTAMGIAEPEPVAAVEAPVDQPTAAEAQPAEQPAANDDEPELAPSTEPVITSSGEDEAGEDGKPRRTGWWARRSFF